MPPRRRTRRAATPQRVFPFFTGCQRSGTTLLREIFNAHPEVAIPPEAYFIPAMVARRRRYERAGGFDVDRFIADLVSDERFGKWRVRERAIRRSFDAVAPVTLADALRSVYASFARRHDKPLYGDKTPRYATEIDLLADLFPEARFVHVTRDGRNVALSLVEVSFGPTRLEHASLYWRERVRAARAAGRALGPDRYFEYRHEDLLEDPEEMARRICSFLDMEFHQEMLRYPERQKPIRKPHMASVNQPPTRGLREWRPQMEPADVRLFELLAGDLLEELGYQRVTDEHTLGSARERDLRRRARRLERMDTVRLGMRRAQRTPWGRAIPGLAHRMGRRARGKDNWAF